MIIYGLVFFLTSLNADVTKIYASWLLSVFCGGNEGYFFSGKIIK